MCVDRRKGTGRDQECGVLKEHEHPPKSRLLIRAFFCSSGGHGQGRRRYRDSARGEAVIKAHGSKMACWD